MFIFVIVCGHFEWQRICAGFDSLFIYVLSLCYYQERRVGVPLTCVILPRLCACPKSGSRFPTSYVVVLFMFNDLRREVVVRLVDTGGIVDHHYFSATNKNVDIKFSGEDAFLEYYSNLHQKERSCAQKVYVKFVYVIFGAINCE